MASQAVLTSESVWILSGQVSASESVREIPINLSPFQVGRRPDLSFYIPSPTVSTLHAEIVFCGERLILRDLQSTNGTYANGSKVNGEVELHEGDIIQFANVVFRLKRQSHCVASETLYGDNYNRALALIQFDRLISERAVVPFFQPIVDAKNHTLYGYEVVGRSYLFGLSEPISMFQAAAQLNLESELSRLCRFAGIEASRALQLPPHLFLNTHPVELNDAGVLELSLQDLRESHPDQPITLEIHESAVTDQKTMSRIRRGLHDLNIRLAYDDFGAGQARLVELIEVPPDYVKFDIHLIRGIDKGPAHRQRMLASLVRMVSELGIKSIAEGIETAGEAAACEEFGFTLDQGFYFGVPSPVEALKDQ